MKTLMFWSCAGADASELSFGTAALLSQKEKTLIAELPCLGIPRLGFVCGMMDRGRNTEAAIVYFEQNKKIEWDMVQQANSRLSVLPASVFAVPDYPAATRVSVETLTDFVPALQVLARSRAYGRLVLECQGQLNSPMTFFSLKLADRVIIPLAKATEAAYALACIRRLVQVYRHRAEKFILAAPGNGREIRSAIKASGGEDAILHGLRFAAADSRKIRRMLEAEEACLAGSEETEPEAAVNGGLRDKRSGGMDNGVSGDARGDARNDTRGGMRGDTLGGMRNGIRGGMHRGINGGINDNISGNISEASVYL